jgi:glycolate oxidase FAD binding subunit
MSQLQVDRISAAVGADNVATRPDGRLVVTPTTGAAMAGVLGLAHDEGWQVAIEGSGSWQPDTAPAALMLSTRGLDDRVVVRADEMTVTAQAGAPFDAVRQAVREQGGWLSLDPPGRTDRTIGSILATATSGPLRAGFGPLRDQVRSLTVASADGRVTQVSRETASESALRLHVGGFGGFGVITEATLRVHALPQADTTWVALGSRDRLSALARDIGEAGITAAAAELLSPALASEGEWLLAVRFVGSRDAVLAAAEQLHAVGHSHWHELPIERRILLWNSSARGLTSVPVTFRLGALPEGIDEAIDMVLGMVGEGMLSAGALAGSIRWSGHASVVALQALRARLAAREIPLTLERAPWEIRRVVGHFGAYREGIGGPVDRMRERHDPAHILVTGMTGEANS